MKGLLFVFIGIFLFIWGVGAGISYLKRLHAETISAPIQYGDFSPAQIEADRKKMMSESKRQLQNFKNSQQASTSSQQDAQRRFMEDQKRQLEDLKRLNQIH